MKRFVFTWLATTAVLTAASCALEPGEDASNIQDAPAVERNPDLIDRMGRPEITNFLVRGPDFKPAYNAADSFALSPEQTGQFRAMIGAGIQAWDAFDTNVDWDAEGDGKDLAEVLADDYLVVDPNIACDVDTDSYFEIELSAPGEHQTCGGRTPNPDVIDQIMTLLVAGPAATVAYRDGVDGVPRPAEQGFPFLVSPHATPEPPSEP